MAEISQATQPPCIPSCRNKLVLNCATLTITAAQTQGLNPVRAACTSPALQPELATALSETALSALKSCSYDCTDPQGLHCCTAAACISAAWQPKLNTAL